MEQEYEYVDTTGNLQKVKAPDASTAIKNAPNISPTSGVSLFKPTPAPETPTVPEPPETPEPEVQEDTQVDIFADQRNQLSEAQKLRERADKDYEQEANNVRKTILNIQNGTVPFSEAERAQIAGLEQQFGALIEQQKLTNIGAQGLANIRGYQKGAAEYDPTFQVKTIGSIVTGGINKIADLNVKMAAAVADLSQSIKDKKISAVKDAWAIYQDANNRRTETLNKTIEETQKAIEEAQKQQRLSQIEGGIIEMMGKGITDPAQILKEVNKAGNYATSQEIAEALKNLSEEEDFEKLTGDAKNFFILKDIPMALPESITKLPEDRQLFAYIKMNKAATTKPTSGPAANKLTLAEAKRYGWPISLVGMSEEQLIASLQSAVPPAWFVQYLIDSGALGKGLITDTSTREQVLQDAWENFRNETMGSFSGEEDEDESPY
jgi:hypothetical protein